MFYGLKNKVEDFYRKRNGREAIDREITNFLNEKYKEHLDLNEINDAKQEIVGYLDDLELRADLLQNKTVLDVGSNKHFFDEYCKKKYNTQVVALDIDMEDLGDKHQMGVVTDAKVLPFKNEAFDLVVSHASMPHLLVIGENEDGEMRPLEGELKEKSLADALSLFKETYRVLKKGGQVRMSTFSEAEERYLQTKVHQDFKFVLDHQISRIKVIKEALGIFERESGARCIFKDERGGGLIIIMKLD